MCQIESLKKLGVAEVPVLAAFVKSSESLRELGVAEVTGLAV